MGNPAKHPSSTCKMGEVRRFKSLLRICLMFELVLHRNGESSLDAIGTQNNEQDKPVLNWNLVLTFEFHGSS